MRNRWKNESKDNSTTGLADPNFRYLFQCRVKNGRKVENDIKNRFPNMRVINAREMYFYNPALFDDYIGFIKNHESFVEEVFIKQTVKKRVKIVKKTTPTLAQRGLTKKDVLQKAAKVKNDEFYTRYEDVEKEIVMYPPETWRDKCVFCNCDGAVGETRTNKDSSAFALFFIRNFVNLGLKKLICTHYSGQMDLFNAGAKGYVFTKDGVREMTQAPKKYTGSFDDPLSLQILRYEADIVCTNPPFSRAADYWETVIESGKKFLIISNFTNCKNDKYIPYFISGKAWAGYNRVDWFENPKREKVCASGHWYCNLPISDRPKYKNMKFLPLREIPDKYKKYDDKKVLILDNNYIPTDYKKPFAVSVYPILSGVLEKGYKIVQPKQYRPYINGKEVFARVLIQQE